MVGPCLASAHARRRRSNTAEASGYSRGSRHPRIHHVDLLVVGTACDLPADPIRKRKLDRLRRKFDFCQDDTSQYPLVDIDLPRELTARDEVSGLCKRGTQAMMGDQLLGIGSRNLILEFG